MEKNAFEWKWLLLVTFFTIFLNSCSKDEYEPEPRVKPSFDKIEDIVEKKLCYDEVVDENFNHRYRSLYYNTISFYSDGTYKRTQDIYSSTGTYTFSNKTVHCTEYRALTSEKTTIDYQFIDTNKEGYYFKEKETIYYNNGEKNLTTILYYRFLLTDAK